MIKDPFLNEKNGVINKMQVCSNLGSLTHSLLSLKVLQNDS